MNEHALDAMIYAWQVMKEKEENKMDNVFMGKIVGSCSRISEEDGKRCASIYFHDTESNACDKLSHYNKTYSLVLSDDVIKTNDELLKMRDEVRRLTEVCNGWENECNDWKKRYTKANIELFQKGLAYGMLEETYKHEKIAGEMLLKDRDALKEKVEKLEAELMEIKTTRTLREAYITGVEKGCESLREERDRWKNRCNSVMTDISNALSANGIEFTLKEINVEGNWDVVIDIPELNEAKDKIIELEQKVRDERRWCDYWRHTYYAAEKIASVVGVSVTIDGIDGERNSAKVVVRNDKAEDLEKQVVQMEDANQKLRQRISAADEEIERLEVKHNAKWSAMTEALKKKGVEVIYMGEEDSKPIVDVKIPGWDKDKEWVATFSKRVADLLEDKFGLERERDELKEQCDILRKDYIVRGQAIDDLKKELKALKSRTLDNVEIRLSYGDIVWTYCDGFVHVSSGISGIITADEIATGTVPKCSSCAHYMHNPSRFAHDWCYMPIPKEGGAGYIRKLNKEESEGPACSDFKAKE